MYENLGDVGFHEGNTVVNGTAEYLYFPSEPLIPLGPLPPIDLELIQHVYDATGLYAYQDAFGKIEPFDYQDVSGVIEPYAYQPVSGMSEPHHHAHDTRNSLKRSFDCT